MLPVASSNSFVILIAFSGHVSAHMPQNMHLPTKYFKVMVLPSVVNMRALGGHIRVHAPHPTHLFESISIAPRNESVISGPWYGYLMVTVPVFAARGIIFKNLTVELHPMALEPFNERTSIGIALMVPLPIFTTIALSVQEKQGSILAIVKGTSARSASLSIIGTAGRF